MQAGVKLSEGKEVVLASGVRAGSIRPATGDINEFLSRYLAAGPLVSSGKAGQPVVVDLDVGLRSYLIRQGWREDAEGPAGSLWRHPRPSGPAATVAVPRRVDVDSLEWRGLLSRLAAHELRPARDIVLNVATQYVDIARLKAQEIDESVGTIPLDVGSALVHYAQSMVRSTATTSLRPKPQIAGNYLTAGDEIASRARMAHTEQGSYVLPVWIPITPPDAVSPTEPPIPHLDYQRLPSEPVERRVTRTIAQVLNAINELVVQPAREIRNFTDLQPLVAAGCSRELLVALNKLLTRSTVREFEAAFAWAPAVGAPGGLLRTVSIPTEAAPLLEQAAKILRRPGPLPGSIFTGKIVEVRHEVDDPFGEIAIDTVRSGRRCEVRARLTAQQLIPAFDWAKAGRAVLIEGPLRRVSRQLIVDKPVRVMPVDETFLPFRQDDEQSRRPPSS